MKIRGVAEPPVSSEIPLGCLIWMTCQLLHPCGVAFAVALFLPLIEDGGQRQPGPV